jgi:hypothetical protein
MTGGNVDYIVMRDFWITGGGNIDIPRYNIKGEMTNTHQRDTALLRFDKGSYINEKIIPKEFNNDLAKWKMAVKVIHRAGYLMEMSEKRWEGNPMLDIAVGRERALIQAGLVGAGGEESEEVEVEKPKKRKTKSPVNEYMEGLET